MHTQQRRGYLWLCLSVGHTERCRFFSPVLVKKKSHFGHVFTRYDTNRRSTSEAWVSALNLTCTSGTSWATCRCDLQDRSKSEIWYSKRPAYRVSSQWQNGYLETKAIPWQGWKSAIYRKTAEIDLIYLPLISFKMCCYKLASCFPSVTQGDWSLCRQVLAIQTSSLDRMLFAGTSHYFSLAHKLQPQNILSHWNDKPNKREIHLVCPCRLAVTGAHH